MSEYIDNQTKRQEALKRVIRQLHEGKSVDEVKAEFAALLEGVSAAEIAVLEQGLIAEGMPEIEIKRLCDVHVAAFKDALDAQEKPESLPSHPVYTYRAENAAAQVLDALGAAIKAGQWKQAREGVIPLQTGALAPRQIALMMTHLPVDVTFVDENDAVQFFSATKERIFPRSPSIIGRSVQKCHPPASVHRVQRILDDFREGRRDEAEFWIQMGPAEGGGKFIHIRYFAIRDEEGVYQGTLEVSQDVTAIRALEGERRLLDEGRSAASP